MAKQTSVTESRAGAEVRVHPLLQAGETPSTAARTAMESAPKDGTLTPAQLVAMYRLMYLSRRVDDREIVLKRQQKIFFQISCAGHEAIQVAAAMAMRPGYDWFLPYYRDRALCLALGNTAEEQLMQAVGAASDIASGGRQMPSHWSRTDLHIVSTSSATATQCLHGVGCAEAGRYLRQHAACKDQSQADGADYRAYHPTSFRDDEVTYIGIGEGSTSQGEFWEALSAAANAKLPVVIVVQDNGYAISTPVEVNTPGGKISKVIGFPNFHIAEVDGTDIEKSYAAMREAVEWARSGRGPALVHGHVIRPYSHSLSDDEKLYRSKEERNADALRDPISILQMRLLREKILDEEGITALEHQVDEELQRATDAALAAAPPKPESIPLHVYSEVVDPTGKAFDTSPHMAKNGVEHTMADLINHTLHEEMRRDERIVVFGEDVADATRAEALRAGKIKGKGGVFKLTHGLQAEFGDDRCFNSQLAEANIVGRAFGMAVRGLKPIVEIQFFDYIWPAIHQMRNEISVMRWRSNGTWSCPMVIRCPIGGYLTGGSIYHSQSGESIMTHTPGIRVVMPSNALDAAGLLRTAIRCDDPVLFLEHKRLYRETYGRSEYPGHDYMIPFGKAKVVHEGRHLTFVTYGATVPRALQAAKRLKQEKGTEVEVIDLRSLSPYDWETIANSVRKTNRCIVAHEDMRSWGYGAEIAARIGDELFHDLDAPVRRVAGMDTFVAYQPLLEDVILPQPDDFYRAMAELAAF